MRRTWKITCEPMSTVAQGEWRGIAGLALAFIGWHKKLRLEEAFMTAHFGAEYTAYQRAVKALIPFIL
jgi:protein-S-isoprenylcysteine O-methyltransferase Ste14